MMWVRFAWAHGAVLAARSTCAWGTELRCDAWAVDLLLTSLHTLPQGWIRLGPAIPQSTGGRGAAAATMGGLAALVPFVPLGRPIGLTRGLVVDRPIRLRGGERMLDGSGKARMTPLIAICAVSGRAVRCSTLWALRGRSGEPLGSQSPRALQDVVKAPVGVDGCVEGEHTCRGVGCAACASVGRAREAQAARSHLPVASKSAVCVHGALRLCGAQPSPERRDNGQRLCANETSLQADGRWGIRRM